MDVEWDTEEPEIDWGDEEEPEPRSSEDGPSPKKGLGAPAKLGIVFAVGAGVLLLLVILGVALMSPGGSGVFNLDPTAGFSISRDEALTLEVIELDAGDSEDTDGDIVKYYWDLDSDGIYDNTTDEPELEYAFPDNGNYKITLKVEDDGGATDTTSNTVTINNRPPEISASSSLDEADTFEVITYSCQADDLDGNIISCSWDFDGDGNDDWTEGSSIDTELVYQFPQDGEYTSVFTVTDDDGDTNRMSIDITINNQPPTIDVVIPKTTYYTYEQINISLSVKDIDGQLANIDVDYEGDHVIDDSFKTVQFYHQYTDDGKNTLTIYAYDDDGDYSTKEIQLTILNRAPEVSAGIDSEISPYVLITYQQVQFFADVLDMDGKIKQYRWDLDGDGDWDYEDEDSPTTTHYYTDDGTYLVKFSATDDDGASTMDSFTVTVNNKPPEVTLTADDTEVTTYTQVTFTADAQDEDGWLTSFEWDFDGDGYYDHGPTLSNIVDHSFTEDGVFNVKVKVTDNDDATTERSVGITVLNSPPGATIEFKNNATTNQELHIAAIASDVDGTVVQYQWDFDGDMVFDKTTTVHEVFHQFTSEGINTINVKVTDDDGGSGYVQDSVNILYNSPPVADAGQDVVIAIGEYANLDGGNSTDPEGDDITYSWDFDSDGTYEIEDSYQADTSKQFNTEGTFTVTLKVFDGEKYAMDTVNVQVISPVNRWAVVIGISDYPGSGNDLYYCDDDADDWDTYLTGKGYTVQKLIDSQATWSNLQTQINWMKTNSDENDIVVFTYSGHGIYYGGDSHMCLYDGDRSAGTLASAMSGLTSERVFYFFDCCNSGSFGDNLGAADSYVAQGCRTDEYTIDDPTYTNGGFTHFYLNDGLRSHGSWSAEDAFDNAYTKCVNRYGFHPIGTDGDTGNEFYF